MTLLKRIVIGFLACCALALAGCSSMWKSLKRTFDDVGYFARKRYRHARKKVSRRYGDAPNYVSDNPSWSL